MCLFSGPTNVLHGTSCWNQRGTRKHTVFNLIKSGGGWVCFKLADFWCPDFAILATFTVFKKPKHCEYIMNIGVATLKYNHGTGLISKRIPRGFFCTQSSSKSVSLNFFFNHMYHSSYEISIWNINPLFFVRSGQFYWSHVNSLSTECHQTSCLINKDL